MNLMKASPMPTTRPLPQWFALESGTHDIQDGEWVVWPRVRYFHVPTQTYHPSHDVFPLVPYDEWIAR